jgi:tripartite-type tricarboxylate transporter receptor subunit TctC
VDLVISSWHGVFAPRGTPREVVARLSAALQRLCGNPEFVSHMRNLLLDVRYLDSNAFREFFAGEDKLNLELIRKLGLYVAPQSQTK